jgi:hypothetical protein
MKLTFVAHEGSNCLPASRSNRPFVGGLFCVGVGSGFVRLDACTVSVDAAVMTVESSLASFVPSISLMGGSCGLCSLCVWIMLTGKECSE